MPGFPVPDSGGAPVQDNASGGGPRSGFLPSGKPGGQITISRREALALIAFDSEDDEGTAIARARRETSFDDDQLARLKTRAEKVRAKGYTLTNGAHKFMPTNFDGDTDSLLGQEEQRGDAKNRGMRDGRRASAADKAGKTDAKGKKLPMLPTTKQGPGPSTASSRTQEAWSRVHECDGNEACGACQAAHAAAAPAREAYAKRMREKKRRSCGTSMHESGRRLTEAERFEQVLEEAQGPMSFTILTEKWSDEARAAAAAARKAKGGGKDWRTAARKSFYNASKGKGVGMERFSSEKARLRTGSHAVGKGGVKGGLQGDEYWNNRSRMQRAEGRMSGPDNPKTRDKSFSTRSRNRRAARFAGM